MPSNEPSWRLYDLGVTPRKGNEKAFLNPEKFGGLEYEILGYEDNGRSAVIKTQDFGVGKVYIDVGAIVNDGSGKGSGQSKVGRTFTPHRVPLTLRDAKGVRIGAPSNTMRSYRILEVNGILLKIEHPLFDPVQVWAKEADGVIS